MSHSVLTEQLKCSECAKYLSCLPVLTVLEDGSNICGRCLPPFDSPRCINNSFQNVCAWIQFSCSYQEEGCTETLLPSEIPSHENVCPFRIPCPLVDCNWKGRWADSRRHCRNQHSDKFFEKAEFDFDFTKSHTEGNFLELASKTLLLVQRKFEAEQNLLTVSIRHLDIDKLDKIICTLNFQRDETSFCVDCESVNFRLGSCKETVVDLTKNGVVEENPANLEMLTVLKCWYCSDLVLPPIYQISANVCCSECQEKLSEEEKLSSLRNIALDRIADMLDYPCRYSKKGCSFVSKPDGMRKHYISCIYNDQKCGWRSLKQPACQWKGARNNVLEHVRSSHMRDIIKSHNGKVYLSFKLNNHCKVSVIEISGMYFQFGMFFTKGSYVCCISRPLWKTEGKHSFKYQFELFNKEGDKKIVVEQNIGSGTTFKYHFDNDQLLRFSHDYKAHAKISISRTTSNYADFNRIPTIPTWKCSVCGNLLSHFPVTLTADNANICGRCSLPPNSQYTRNRIYEIAVQKIKFPCRYQQHGCYKQLVPSQIPVHEKTCPYRTCECPTKQFTGCIEQMPHCTLKQHCQNKHSSSISKGGTFEIELSGPEEKYDVLECGDEIWILVKKFDPNRRLLRLSITSREDQKVPDHEVKLKSFSRELLVRSSSNTSEIYLHSLIAPEKATPFRIFGSISWVQTPDELLDRLRDSFFAKPLRPSKPGVSKLATRLAKHPCKYVTQGCRRLLSTELLEFHENFCSYRPKLCPFGYYEMCEWSGSREEVQNHVVTEHRNLFTTSTLISTSICPPQPPKNYRYICWFTVDVFFVQCYIFEFFDNLFSLIFLRRGDKFFWVVEMLGEFKDEFRYEIEILDKNQTGKKIILGGSCVQRAADVLERQCYLHLEQICPLAKDNQIIFNVLLYTK